MTRALLLIGALLALASGPAAAQEAVEYYATDALGSIRVVFASNGTVKGRMDFGPYGEQLTTAEGIGQKVFAQITFDGETAMDYAEARIFQLRTGRFNAPDPILASIANPQSLNRYGYVANNPMSFVDPSGLVALQCTSIPDDSAIGREFHLRISQCNLVSSAGTQPEQHREKGQPAGRDKPPPPGPSAVVTTSYEIRLDDATVATSSGDLQINAIAHAVNNRAGVMASPTPYVVIPVVSALVGSGVAMGGGGYVASAVPVTYTVIDFGLGSPKG